MFTTESALVKIWVRNVNNGNYTQEQVPKLSNLREMVYIVLDAQVQENTIAGDSSTTETP